MILKLRFANLPGLELPWYLFARLGLWPLSSYSAAATAAAMCRTLSISSSDEELLESMLVWLLCIGRTIGPAAMRDPPMVTFYDASRAMYDSIIFKIIFK